MSGQASTLATLLETVRVADEQLAVQAAVLSAKDPLEAHHKTLDSLELQVQLDLNQTSKLVHDTGSVDEIDLLTQRWANLRDSTDLALRSLLDTRQQLEALVVQLTTLRARYETWQGTARDNQAPASLLDHLRTQQTSTDDLISKARERLDQITPLNLRLDAIEARAVDTLSEMRGFRERLLRDLTLADGPLLWQLDLRPAALFGHEGLDLLNNQVHALTAYLHKQGYRCLIHLILIGLLSSALLRLKRVLEAHALPEGGLDRLPQVLVAPGAAAVVVSMLFAEGLYPGPPTLLRPLLGLLALVPAVRFVFPLVTPGTKRLLRGLVATYLCDLVRDLLSTFFILNRILCAVETGVAALLLGAFLLQARRARTLARAASAEEVDPFDLEESSAQPPTPKTETGNRGGKGGAGSSETSFLEPQAPVNPPLSHLLVTLWAPRLALAGLVLSTIANLLGYVSLSRLLAHIVLGSSYVAVLLFAFLRLGYGLGRVFLRIPPLCKLSAVSGHLELLEDRTRRGWIALGYLAWTLELLRIASLRTQVGELVEHWLHHPLLFGLTLGAVGKVVLALLFAHLISRLLRFVLEEDVYPRLGLSRGNAYVFSTVAHYVIMGGGILVALGTLGASFEKFTVLAGALSVGVGFGLQNIVKNFTSGIILLVENPFKIGDVIAVKGQQGTLTEIGLRSSRMQTSDGAEVVLPNDVLLSNEVVNSTTTARNRVIELTVSTPSNVPPLKVLGKLVQIAARHADVVNDPAPQALLTDLSDGRLEYELSVWVSEISAWKKVRSDLYVAIYESFSQSGIPLSGGISDAPTTSPGFPASGLPSMGLPPGSTSPPPFPPFGGTFLT